MTIPLTASFRVIPCGCLYVITHRRTSNIAPPLRDLPSEHKYFNHETRVTLHQANFRRT